LFFVLGALRFGKVQSTKHKLRSTHQSERLNSSVFRIGIGTDTHRLVEGRPLILGGVSITSDLGAEGHSDGDALSHAIADAILGALCQGDLGVHFPDRDPHWSGADSLELLSRVMWLARERNLRVVNVDSTIMLEAPRLRVYIDAMRQNIADVLEVDLTCVSVKAKTGEGLDAVGQRLAVSVQAVVLMQTAKETRQTA